MGKKCVELLAEATVAGLAIDDFSGNRGGQYES
jgi:hypothetical protein